ncbi:MAG: hypothetical protein BWK75_01250 [Candidatus Altiarchaeales archaeon A3]|nr:MAG: hypothetical protein BWK75_01250 [Candidatus Altiarchaeales archaeon A3]
MEKEFSLTGNPWIDNGIVSFIDSIKAQPYVNVEGVLTFTYKLKIEDDKKEKFKTDLGSILKSNLDNSYLLNKHFKVLINKKFMNSPPTGKDYTFSDDEIKVLKDFEKESKEKGKTINFNIKDKKANVKFSRSNAIAPLKDYSKEEITNIIGSFISEIYSNGPKNKCPVCGSEVSKLVDLLQNLNPFTTKHHNKLRGYTGQSSNEKGCSICSLFGLVSTLDEYIPYTFVDVKNGTLNILPVVKDIEILEKIKKNLKISLKNLNNPDELNYVTNMKRRLSNDKYSVMLGLYDQLVNKYSVDAADIEKFEPLNKEDLSRVYRWVRFNIKSGQTYKMSSFSSIKPSDNLYDFVKEDYGIEPFNDVFEKIRDFCARNKKEILFEIFSKGLVTSDVDTISQFLFTAYKNRDENNTLYLSKEYFEGFYMYFKNLINKIYGDEKMDTNLIEDAKTFGIHMGKNLTRDIGLMTKLYNVTSKDDLSDVIKESLMKMYKIGLKGEDLEIKESRVTNIIGSLNEDNWKEIANVIFIFAALRAINTKTKGGQ